MIQDSTLSAFITILQEVFTAEPPVYTKPATTSSSTSPTGPTTFQHPTNPNLQPPNYSQSPIPPYSSTASPILSPSQAPPPIPPNPLHANRLSTQPQQQQQQQQRPLSPSTTPAPPPIPSKIPTSAAGGSNAQLNVPQVDPKVARLNELKARVAQRVREREREGKVRLAEEIERLLG
ncbi:hypothetical protein HK097_007545, partial [Rhizophlyctis rosea]